MIETVLCTIGGTLVGFITAYALLSLMYRREDKKVWNNGICPQCGKPWRFKSYNKGERIYMCDNYHFCHIKYGQDNW